MNYMDTLKSVRYPAKHKCSTGYVPTRPESSKKKHKQRNHDCISHSSQVILISVKENEARGAITSDIKAIMITTC
jgi:hypothetical protein